jgi:small-conductance mechanosensitive channel
MSEAAAAQVRGPPVAKAQGAIDADISRQDDLDRRLQVIEQKLSSRQDSGAAQLLSQAQALQTQLRSQPNMSAGDLNTIEASVQRLENAVG